MSVIVDLQEERLRGRKTESEEAIKKRLQTAEKEMEFSKFESTL